MLSRTAVAPLNLTPHEIRANAAAIGLNANSQFSIYNQAGTVDAVIDVTGRFDASPGSLNTLTGNTSKLTPHAATLHEQPS